MRGTKAMSRTLADVPDAIPAPIRALRQDHARALGLLRLLTDQLAGMTRLAAGDLAIAHDIFRYMTGFVDGQHHAREDEVIAALHARDPRLKREVAQTVRVHDELRHEGQALLGALDLLRARRAASGRQLVMRLRHYATTLAAHFEAEEQELFVRAAALLSPQDWRRVAGAGADPLFGAEVERGFEGLFETYVARVREIGAPSAARTSYAAAALVDSAAAVLDGARATVAALRTTSRRTMDVHYAGAAALAGSRSLVEAFSGAWSWTFAAFDEAAAGATRLHAALGATTRAALEPIRDALAAQPPDFGGVPPSDPVRPSWQAQLVNLGMRATVKRMAGKASIEIVRGPRSSVENLMPKLARDVTVTQFKAGAGQVEQLEIAGSQPPRTVLHMPGGGFVMGATQAHRLMAARLARATDAAVALVHYRLAPEHPFPAGLDDCVTAYRQLLDAGVPPETIVLSGDSAGGGLALSCLLRIRDAGLPLPAAAVLLSPVADLSYAGESRRRNAWADPILPNDERNVLAELYLGDTATDDPLASPLFADLSGLPPLLILVGSTEVLLDDALRVAAKVRRQGGECECEVWHEMPHDWMLWGMLPEAKKALARVAAFIAEQTPVRVRGRVRGRVLAG